MTPRTDLDPGALSDEDEDVSPLAPWVRPGEGSWQRRGMSDPLLRHMAMLKLVPRLPRKIAAPVLKERLIALGHPIDLRSVQRDLKKLSSVFPLVCDGRRPQGWSFTRDAPVFDLPTLDIHAAITLRLVEDTLTGLLPRTTLDVLRPQFKNARATLKRLRHEGLPSWGEKVRAIPRAQPLRAPVVDATVHAAVYDALLEERQLEVRYRNRQGKVTDGVVHPLALVFRDALPILVCTWFETYDDIRQLALPRIERAVVANAKRRVPKDFDVDRVIASGELSFRVSEKPVKLVLRVHPDAARSIIETPLDDAQRVSVDDDGWTRVEARVMDTRVLRGWILGFGEMIEVVGPAAVRREVAARLRRAAGMYGG